MAHMTQRMERRLEHDMSGFDDMGLPDAPDCLLEAFEGGTDRTANILRQRYQLKSKLAAAPVAPVEVPKAAPKAAPKAEPKAVPKVAAPPTDMLKPQLLPSFATERVERPSWADMSTDSEDEDLSSSRSLRPIGGISTPGDSWSSYASTSAGPQAAGLAWDPICLESSETQEPAPDADVSTGPVTSASTVDFSWSKVWAQMNLGKLEHVSPVSSESPTQDASVGYPAQMLVMQPAEASGQGLAPTFVQQVAQPPLLGGQVQMVQPMQPMKLMQPMVMMIPATPMQFSQVSQGYHNMAELDLPHGFHPRAAQLGNLTPDCRTFTKTKSKGRLSIVSESRLHHAGVVRYCVRFTEGELSNADGVGIVFSSQLPCPQNIQKIISIFANRTGRICMRADADVERSHVSIKALELGDWLEVACDFDRRQVTFTVWPTDGNASTATVDFSGGVERFRRLSAKVPQCACGYLAVVMKHPGLSVSFD